MVKVLFGLQRALLILLLDLPDLCSRELGFWVAQFKKFSENIHYILLFHLNLSIWERSSLWNRAWEPHTLYLTSQGFPLKMQMGDPPTLKSSFPKHSFWVWGAKVIFIKEYLKAILSRVNSLMIPIYPSFLLKETHQVVF